MTTEIPDEHIREIKEIRVAQQKIVDRLHDLLLSDFTDSHSEEVTQSRIHAKGVRHWLGESLGIIRDSNPELQHPYPHADNPANSLISPTADV